MSEFFHSVTLDRDLCHGCINCVKRCPTEAIRVRDGKAKILSDRCIDCGECIRICPHHAKKPIFDPLSVMDQYEYTVALPAPSLYGQFNNLDDVEIILRALIDMGFDDIFEVSRAAELVSDATRKMLSEGQLPRPVISSACPAVVRLIRVRFPDLIRHILPLQAPVEVAARLAKKRQWSALAFRLRRSAVFLFPLVRRRSRRLKCRLAPKKAPSMRWSRFGMSIRRCLAL